MKRIIILLLVSIILSSSYSLAFTKGNLSSEIQQAYSPNEQIIGWINISLQNEPSNSQLTTNTGESISLIDLLDGNGAEYSCLPEDCQDNYKAINEATSKSSYLLPNSEKTYGFKITGKLKEITSLTFNFSSNAIDSCTLPLFMDIGNDENVDWQQDRYTKVFSCSKSSGCFDLTKPLSNAIFIENYPYCEKVLISKKPAYKLIANIFKNQSSSDLTFKLLDSDGAEISTCLNDSMLSIQSGWQEVSCITEDILESGEYYLCISAEEATDYMIRAETSEPTCGFAGELTGYFDSDYDLSVAGAKYSRTINIGYNTDKFAQYNADESLANYLNYYISSRYYSIPGTDKMNCTDGCVIPFNFNADINQSLSLFNIDLRYVAEFASNTNKIYDIQTEPAKLNSGYIQLDLETANFSAPPSYGNNTFIIYLNGIEVVNKKITVEKIPIINDVLPREVPAAVQVIFTAHVFSPSNKSIVSYQWDFGDGETSETEINKTSYAYSSIGVYDLTLTIEDAAGLSSSKSFSITVGSPEEAINATLKKYKERISDIETELSSFSAWQKSIIEEKIALEDLKDEINSIEQDYLSASSDEELASIMGNLSSINVPYHLGIKESGNFPFFIEPEDINPTYVSTLSQEDLDTEYTEEDYISAIEAWAGKNAEMNLDYKTISLYYDRDIFDLFSIFNLDMTFAEAEEKEMYVIIPHLEIKFNGDYSEKDLSDSTGIKFTTIESRAIEFAIPDEVSPEDLNLFLSPEFSQLELITEVPDCNNNDVCEKDDGETWKNCRNDCMPTGWLIFYIVLLLVIAFIVYIILAEWYKRRYENHLFKNRSDLYNLVNFVKNALNQGMDKGEINSRLKKAGWNGEQIAYAFKKSKGLRTGMIELPIFRLFKKKQPPLANLSQPPFVRKGF